jgi:hypothetical protein
MILKVSVSIFEGFRRKAMSSTTAGCSGNRMRGISSGRTTGGADWENVTHAGEAVNLNTLHAAGYGRDA